MNRTQIIDTVADRTGVERGQVRIFLEALVETISESLARGERVSIMGFGSFVISGHGERRGVNPRTLEPMTIVARRSIRFHPSPQLSDKLK